MSLMPFLSQIVGHPPEQTAIIDSHGEHTFGSLVQEARLLAGSLRQMLSDSSGTDELPRIAFMAGRQASSAVAMLAIWMADAVAVPLDPLMSLPEWQWRLEDIGIKILLYAPDQQAEAQYIAHCSQVTLMSTEQKLTDPASLRLPSLEKSALILFASQGDNRPVPVIHSFRSLSAQVQALVNAWDWQPEDHLLHVLPLSNQHGLINGVLGSMAAGCCCEILASFRVHHVWDRLASGNITLFTASPTIYQYLLDAWNKAPEYQKRLWQIGVNHLRQSLVGSSTATPLACKQWQQITGKPLHFRYGMTETGIIFHNSSCTPDRCGEPMPGVSLRLVDENGHSVSDEPGELEVRTSQLFKGYFDNSTLTDDHYNHGWFRTGDLAVKQGDSFRLLGHRDLNVIKIGGYRVSATDIETVLNQHPDICECAILGAPCKQWGETVCAFIVPKENPVALPDLRDWLTPQLPTYKLPTQLTILNQLPRTQLGSVDKLILKRELTSHTLSVAS